MHKITVFILSVIYGNKEINQEWLRVQGLLLKRFTQIISFLVLSSCTNKALF